MARSSAKKKEKEGNEQHNIVEMGGNISGLLESVAKARDEIINIDKEIKSLQADKKAIRENMESKGVTKDAFDKALSYFRQDPDQRKGFDMSYAIAREGMGLPIKQGDLFEKEKPAAAAPQREDDNTTE